MLAPRSLRGNRHRDWFGLQLSYNNRPSFVYEGPSGFNWFPKQMPYLTYTQGNPNEVALGARPGKWSYFTYNTTSSVYASQKASNGRQMSLVADSGNGQFVYREMSGRTERIWKMADFSTASQSAHMAGQLISYTNSRGIVTQVTSRTSTGNIGELQRRYTVGSTTILHSLQFNYLSNHIDTAVLRRSSDGTTWTPIRQIKCTYYASGDSYGSPNDLQSVTVKDASGNVISTRYYRYYTQDDISVRGQPGFVHGLKYVVNAQSYRRMAAANSITPTNVSALSSLSDTEVAKYANNYFEYDSTSQAVTKEIAQKAGCSSCNGGAGQGTFTYSRSTNGNGGYHDDYNIWKYKTIETLPDNNTNTIYSNYAGQTMLKVFTDTSTGNQWARFYKYDSRGHQMWRAEPSAVLPPTSGDSYDNHNDLLNNVSGNYQYLRDSDGLIYVWEWADSTSATSTTPGDVQDFLKSMKVQHGETATPILTSSMMYKAHTADLNSAGDHAGTTVYYLNSRTAYHNSDGTGGQTTTYECTYATVAGKATNVVASRIITKPLISTAQNGPGSSHDIKILVYDSNGRLQWVQDEDNFITYFQRDTTTGAVTKKIVDVNTANTSDFTNLPSGWTTPTGGGLHLITLYDVDGMGRKTKVTDPNGNVTYVVRLDSQQQTRIYPGWQSGTSQTTGPVRVKRQDRSTDTTYNEKLTMAPASIATSGGAPTGGEAISNIQTLSRTYLDKSGRLDHIDTYFNFSGLTYSTSTSLGTQNTHFYRTLYGYDDNGRPCRVVNNVGTVTRSVFDALGRVTSAWVGTSDLTNSSDPTSWQSWSPSSNSSPANMTEIGSNEYDSGNVGDGLMTQTTQYVSSTSSENRVTQNWYDWRDRPIATKSGIATSEGDGTHRPIFFFTLDNLNRQLEIDHYDGDGITPTISGGVVSMPSGSSSALRSKTVANYDDQNRPYQKLVYSIDQSNGTVSSTALTTNNYYNHRGELIANSAPGGLVTKSSFDGARRVAKQYKTDGASGTSWSNASDVSSDHVLQQLQCTYDSNGNVILATTKQHNHDDTNTGELGNASTNPKARVSYVANYYDAANRITASLNVGTNGGSAYTRPSSVPSGSDTVLVVSFTYNSAGWQDTLTDPKGIKTAKYYDLTGRITRQIEAYDGAMPPDPSSLPSVQTNKDRATTYTYDGLNHQVTLTAVMPSGTNSQSTQYNYGVTTGSGSNINSNDLLASIQYPNASSGSPGTASTDQETFTYNAIGQPLTAIDRSGTTHAYSYDLLGRKTSDAVTIATGNPQNVDTGVLMQTLNYDTGGRPYQLTSYNSTTASTSNIVNQVQEGYNGLGQLTAEYQSHTAGAAVDTTSTPKVQYAYSEMASGANHSRPITMTYPNGRILHFGYDNSTLDNSISRADYLADDNGSGGIGTHLEDYSYLGQGMIVQRNHAEPGVKLSYIQQSGDSFYSNDGGDQYTGLDRFGRVIDQYWLSSSATTDRFQYGYDRNGNRLYKNNRQNPGLSELYHANSAASGDNGIAYDTLDRLKNFIRGTLSASGNNGSGSLDTVATASTLSNHSENWTLDTLGNWSSQTIDGTSTGRSHDSKNQLTAVGSASLTFDANGNTTTDVNGQTYTYDAWNRMAVAKNSSGTVLASFSYDVIGRRVSRSAGSNTRHFFYSIAWQMLEERINTATSAVRQYVWSIAYIDAMVLRDDNSTSGNLGISGSGLGRRLYVQQDANWNVTALLNTSGAVQERVVYDPYGNNLFLDASGSPTTDSFTWIYLHQGGRLELNTGLYLFRSRDYSSLLGRWMQQDPARYVNGMSLYESVGSNPTRWLDPSGLKWWKGWWEASKALVGMADPQVQAAFDQTNWDRTTGMAQNLPGFQPYHIFDPDEAAKGKCFGHCWAQKMADALLLAGAEKLPGNLGWSGVLPVTPGTYLLGDSWSDVDNLFDANAAGYGSSIAGGFGRGLIKWGESKTGDRAALRRLWKEAGRPDSFADWRAANAETSENMMKWGERAEKVGRGLAAAALAWDLYNCYSNCEKCPNGGGKEVHE